MVAAVAPTGTDRLPPITDPHGYVIPLLREPVARVQAPREPHDAFADATWHDALLNLLAERDSLRLDAAYWHEHWLDERDRAGGWQVIAITAIVAACPLCVLLGYLLSIWF